MRIARRTTIASLVALALAAPAVSQAPAAPPATCKSYGGSCCDPAVAQHLAKEAVFSACGESDATYLGEKGSKDACRYTFKTEDGKGEAYVEIYAPAAKEVPSTPPDPFYAYKKVGKVFVTDKAKSPKFAPTLAAATGLWMPGSGFMVSVRVTTNVCTKAEAMRLARSVR